MAWRCGSRLSARHAVRLRAMFACRDVQAVADGITGHGVDVAAVESWMRRANRRCGRLVSFFKGDGLAIAAALEDERYPLA